MMDQEIVLESVWVAVGFIVFVALVWRKGGAALGSMLDERSKKISSELKEAAALRDDALKELQAYQRLHREAAEEAKTILQSAEATAQRIRETAENKALAAVKRREQQADAKIKAAEASMVAELRERAALLAAATATEIITSKLDKEAGLALVDIAAAEIEKLN